MTWKQVLISGQIKALTSREPLLLLLKQAFSVLRQKANANDKGQTCLLEGKTSKVVLSSEFYRLCDKQVIASAFRQLRINFTCIFRVSKLPSSLRDSGNFVKTFGKQQYSPLCHLLPLMCQPGVYLLSQQSVLLFCGWQNLNIKILLVSSE